MNLLTSKHNYSIYYLIFLVRKTTNGAKCIYLGVNCSLKIINIKYNLFG